ncbi:hypothetical protein DFH29DRAFT_933473 [Suillus ampliporus]|nr:hypothetical protein DFH29DRAFT_933473 [Suillus ampliporus]
MMRRLKRPGLRRKMADLLILFFSLDEMFSRLPRWRLQYSDFAHSQNREKGVLVHDFPHYRHRTSPTYCNNQ